MAVDPIPEGYHTVTPYLVVNGAETVIEFLENALDAEETVRMPGPNGTIGHAEVRVGDSVVMMADPDGEDIMPTMLHVYVADVDATYERAMKAGATSIREPENQFYGDRAGQFEDPFGHLWFVATHVEDVEPEEMQRRAAAMMGG